MVLCVHIVQKSRQDGYLGLIGQAGRLPDRLRALWGDFPVEVRVLFGAWRSPARAGLFALTVRGCAPFRSTRLAAPVADDLQPAEEPQRADRARAAPRPTMPGGVRAADVADAASRRTGEVRRLRQIAPRSGADRRRSPSRLLQHSRTAIGAAQRRHPSASW